MVTFGTITGQEIKENRNGGVLVRLLQVRMSNDVDIQTVQYLPMSGEDTAPQIGDKVAVLSVGPAFQVAVGVQDSITPSVDAGEYKTYSRDSMGLIAAFIFMSTGGNIEIDGSGIIKLTAGTNVELNGNTNSAVTFSPLNTQLQTLVTDINTALGGKLDGSGTGGALTLDLSSAESPTVKLP